MDKRRGAAAAVLGIRIGYGAALIFAPERVAGRWLGRAATRAPTQVALRALGAREIALHAGALRGLLRGAPVRAWLAASVAGDVADILSTAAGRRELPDGAATATLAVGGGSALTTVLVAVALGAQRSAGE
jgi:hypothetical protein